jgi:hypothetical protein
MRTLEFPGYAFGVTTEKRVIVFMEASSDFLAAYSLLHAECMEMMTSPATMLRAENNIHESSLQYFQDKHIVVFPGHESPGRNGTSR